MKNRKHNKRKIMVVIEILSAILLFGCGQENVPQEDVAKEEAAHDNTLQEDTSQENTTMNNGSENIGIENSGISDERNSEAEKETENSSPGEKVMEQLISEWKEMYAAFYDYQDCSAVLSERTEKDGIVEEIFTVDIIYISGLPDGDEPEHFIADMKASYPTDRPDEITLWMDNSGGAMTDFILFKECGPG